TYGSRTSRGTGAEYGYGGNYGEMNRGYTPLYGSNQGPRYEEYGSAGTRNEYRSERGMSTPGAEENRFGPGERGYGSRGTGSSERENYGMGSDRYRGGAENTYNRGGSEYE